MLVFSVFSNSESKAQAALNTHFITVFDDDDVTERRHVLTAVQTFCLWGVANQNREQQVSDRGRTEGDGREMEKVYVVIVSVHSRLSMKTRRW